MSSTKQALVGLLTCPNCGNDNKFLEVVDNIVTTTYFVQNDDGSFTPEENESQSFGTAKLFCAVCETDLSAFHQRFSEMIF